MPNINEFTFWKASCVQNPKNCIYPTKVIVTDADSFNEMAHFDHATAEYENFYRSNDTFLQSDVQSGDVDNDNVANPDDWIAREDIHQIFIGVPHIISESKNHMKPKGSKHPVPRYHVFWKADNETDPKAYAAFKPKSWIIEYYFIFVHEDGAGLERISEIFAQRHIEASVDEVFALEDVNKALKKVAGGKSKGKTVIKINK